MTDEQLFWISYVGFGIVCTIAELVIPARKNRYRKMVPADAVAFAVYQFAIVPAAIIATDPVGELLAHVPHWIFAIPWPVRLVVFLLGADLASYWMHRLMHTKHVWRAHRWHHSPAHIYWLSGVRASLAQQILFTLPTLALLPLLAGMASWVFAAILVLNAVWNHWQHVNVAWRSNWLEYAVVTPRFHHIHHASDAALHDTNFGTIFTIWDRLFGTYRNPDEHVPRTFGTGEKKRDPILMMIGV